ncbi:MAG: HAD family phosphatase [Ruminococcus sp.]|nr:HAD family phosphatase [Ruminococcus sp.]
MNIIFDIGRVLIDFPFEEFVGGLFDKEEAEAVIRATWQNPDWVHLDRADLTDEEVLRLFISKEPEHERAIRHTFARLGECTRLRPTTIPMIKELKAQGHKVYYLSNYFEFLMHAAPWALEFIPYTDGGVFSCHYHITKPDPGIFRILCDKYSIDPADSVFIDDSPKNVKGAEDFGIRAILYTDQTPEELSREIFGE